MLVWVTAFFGNSPSSFHEHSDLFEAVTTPLTFDQPFCVVFHYNQMGVTKISWLPP